MAAELFHTVMRGYDKDEVLDYLDKLISVHEHNELELKARLDASAQTQKQLHADREEAVRKYNEAARCYNVLASEHRQGRQAEAELRAQAEAAQAEAAELRSQLQALNASPSRQREAERQYAAIVAEAQENASKIVAKALLDAEVLKSGAERALAEQSAAKAETAAFLKNAKQIFGAGVDGLLARLGLEPSGSGGSDG